MCKSFCVVSHMASELAENDKHTRNDPSSNDSNEGGFNVEIDDTNVTTFRMTGTESRP